MLTRTLPALKFPILCGVSTQARDRVGAGFLSFLKTPIPPFRAAASSMPPFLSRDLPASQHAWRYTVVPLQVDELVGLERLGKMLAGNSR